ncbi:MAG: metalloregulator ArsR/SmtB family transcription factor [Solirubrobacterales bacterium]
MPDRRTHANHRGDRDIDPSLQLEIAETMQALSSPSRVGLLYALTKGEANVGELAEAVQISPAATSQQLRVLRNLKLVTSRRIGQKVKYRLYDHHVEGLLEEVRNHFEHASRDWSSPESGPSAGGRSRGARLRT